MHVTLNAIRAKAPCGPGWKNLLKHLGKTTGDDEPLLISTILESNGFDDALWSLRALPSQFDGPVRLLACDFAERALRFIPAGEDRPRLAIETARKFAKGEATLGELADAWADAWADARAAAWASARATERAEQERIFRDWLAHMEGQEFDLVVMNPPFYGRHYEKHVRHALKFLKPRGLLVAILPITARYDHRGLEDLKPLWRDLPVGSFSESGTNINTTVMTVQVSS